jgi:hypothetical protein
VSSKRDRDRTIKRGGTTYVVVVVKVGEGVDAVVCVGVPRVVGKEVEGEGVVEMGGALPGQYMSYPPNESATQNTHVGTPDGGAEELPPPPPPPDEAGFVPTGDVVVPGDDALELATPGGDVLGGVVDPPPPPGPTPVPAGVEAVPVPASTLETTTFNTHSLVKRS